MNLIILKKLMYGIMVIIPKAIPAKALKIAICFNSNMFTIFSF